MLSKCLTAFGVNFFIVNFIVNLAVSFHAQAALCPPINPKDAKNWKAKLNIDLAQDLQSSLNQLHKEFSASNKSKSQPEMLAAFAKQFDMALWQERINLTDKNELLAFTNWLRLRYSGLLDRVAGESEQRYLKLKASDKTPVAERLREMPLEVRVSKLATFRCDKPTDHKLYRCADKLIEVTAYLSPLLLCSEAREEVIIPVKYLIRMDPKQGYRIADVMHQTLRLYQGSAIDWDKMRATVDPAQWLKQALTFSSLTTDEISSLQDL